MINFALRQTSKVGQTMLQDKINPSIEDQYSMENMSLSYRAKTQNNIKRLGASNPPHKAKFNAALPMQCKRASGSPHCQ